ncbi:MAG: PmoA family protein [Phycisphaeraceae bacterium]
MPLTTTRHMKRWLIACLFIIVCPCVFAADSEQKTLTLSDGDRPLMVYNAAHVPSPLADAPWYGRSGFIHPVMTPKGNVVTEAFPEDHMHQHGLMFAWTSAQYEGKKVDFWNSHKKQARIEHVETLHADGDRIAVKLKHTITGDRDKPLTVLHETWTLTRVPHDTMNVFDLVSVQTNITDKPLTIRKYKYGGMCIRGAAEWKIKYHMLTSEGHDTAAGNHTRPNWVAMFGTVNDAPAGIAAMSHPDNDQAPQPVRLHPEKPYFCFAPMIADTFQITNEKPYTSRYRFAAFDGKPNAKQLDALMKEFSATNAQADDVAKNE